MPRTQIENRELIPRYIKGRVLEDCRGICAHCGNRLGFYEDFTLEHVIPLSKGGRNDYKNYVALCQKCNQDKSNDIIQPLEYYPYLPKHRQAEIQAMFQDYIKSVDWLSYDNLFMLDWFYIHPNKVITMPKTWKPCFIPMTLKVQKMRRDEAFQWLTEYRDHLSEPDKLLIVKSVDAIDTNYYKIMQGDTILMIITAFLLDNPNQPENHTEENWATILSLDYFINPDVKIQPASTVPTIYNILQEILGEIQSTLLNGSCGTAIPVRMRSPGSGHMVKILRQFFGAVGRGSYEFYELCPDTDAMPDSRIAVTYFIMFQGTKNELKTLLRQHNARSIDELSAMLDKEALQAPLTERLHGTQE